MLSIRKFAHLGRSVPKASLKGLYGGRQVQFGNKVSEWDDRTRRTWKPNVQWARLHSRLLNKSFRIKVTTRILRTVDKKGGLDNYLLYTKNKNIASEFGVDLKNRLKAVLKERGLTQPLSPGTTTTNTQTPVGQTGSAILDEVAKTRPNPFLRDLSNSKARA
ncbi:hypothetical protein IWQ62_005336 [Dispira parvispora]|uniref:Large ribosomal subunit protein bL28m n=1 Tax=Dispira parvispora TaxID=1520584 RepID=A0A9W8AQ50_9FUNG|nr:hypothetical protein IWQ62_005336 [Dispira parvispora]